MLLHEQFEVLIMDYGLERVLEENDITEEETLEILFKEGLLDMTKYFTEEEIEDD